MPFACIYSLEKNMRLESAARTKHAKKFANFLIHIGDVMEKIENRQIQIPNFIKMTESIKTVRKFIYGNNINKHSNNNLTKCTILALLNKTI